MQNPEEDDNTAGAIDETIEVAAQGYELGAAEETALCAAAGDAVETTMVGAIKGPGLGQEKLHSVERLVQHSVSRLEHQARNSRKD